MDSAPRITVLRDDPLFLTAPYKSSSDTFAYEAFAKALLDVLDNNAPPISIGLFGPWGIGKSTIVNILFSKVRADSRSRLFPIYFNAWKYSGDSFRRQFLLEVATAVYGSREDKQVRRLERLNYTEVLAERPESSWLEELTAILTGRVIRTKRSGLIRIILGVFLLAMGVTFSLVSSSGYPIVISIISALFIFALKMKFEDVFVIEENGIFDPKLIFPEQFEKEFQALVRPDSIGGKRAVIVIDDIDRCDPSTIKDILISTKNFVGHTNAYFLIPCDDLNVVNVFEDAAHQAGYRDEMLRKYFNVGLRVPPISSRDLIDFANRMARETNLPEEIIQLAVVADYRDARRIKHFANNFLLKLHIAKTRSGAGYLPPITPERELQLAKLVIIEDCAPPIFARLVQNPALLQILESSATSSAALKEHGLEKWDIEFPGLKKALAGARYVTISDLELLLSLKADNLELKVPSGAQFRAALLQGSADPLAGMLSEVAARGAQQPLADLIDDSLDRATGPLLSNCVAMTLTLPLKSFFEQRDAERVARRLNRGLLRDDQRVWVQSALRIVEVAELFEPQSRQRLFEKYVRELHAAAEQPGSFVETVTLIYPRVPDKRAFLVALNERLLAWCNSEPGLGAIVALSHENLNAGGETFPSDQILGAVLGGFNPLAGGARANELRKDILFAHWHTDYGKTLCPVLWMVIQQQHAAGVFEPQLRFALRTLFEKPEILNNPEGDPIAHHLPPALNRSADDDDRNLVRDCMLAAAAVGQSGGKQTMLAALSSYWPNDSDQRIRRDFDIARRLSADDVSQQIVNAQMAALRRDIQNPTDRTRESLDFLSEVGPPLVPADFFATHFAAALSVNSEPAYQIWQGMISQRRDRLAQAGLLALINKALELVGMVGYLNQRKAALLGLAIGLSSTQPRVERLSIMQKMVEFLWHPDIVVRNSAANALSLLREAGNLGDLRIFLNASIHEHLNKVTISSAPQYQSVVDALASNRDLWNETSARAVAQLAVTLSSDNNLKPMALALLESVGDFDEGDRADVLQALRNIEATHQNLADRVRKLYQRTDFPSGGNVASGTE